MISKAAQYILIIASILSPVAVAYLLSTTGLGDEGGFEALVYLILSLVVGAPTVAIAGLSISAANRKSEGADSNFVAGYVFAAILVCLAILALYAS